jgi:hypothetical protein
MPTAQNASPPPFQIRALPKKLLRDFPSAGVMRIQPFGGAMKRRQKLKNKI